MALKALHSQSSTTDPQSKAGSGGGGDKSRLTEIQQVVTIAAEIERLVLKSRSKLPDTEGKGEASLIEKGDIVSLAEAKRTGLLEQLGHSIKKMVWA